MHVNWQCQYLRIEDMGIYERRGEWSVTGLAVFTVYLLDCASN